MNSFFEESMFAGVTLSIIAYLIGAILKKKFMRLLMWWGLL